MRVLVVNAGSSSLKLSVVVDGDSTVAAENVADADARSEEEIIRRTVDVHGPVDAVGHRIVHGGVDFAGATLLDGATVERIRALTDLAPLHQPKSLHGIDAVTRVLPGVPAVGCFDTAFHARMPRAASTYALPSAWRSRWNLRRFGFHGLSHKWAARRTAELMQRPIAGLRIVSCHLGAGASLCAVDGGTSVETTMGFTPLEGLVMATRSGSVDPGLVLWLAEHKSVAASELTETLDRRSGLLGLSGTADMREVLARDAGGDDAATLALEVYLHRLCSGVAAMMAAMNGADALVFTGGVGEGASAIRARAAAGLAFLGVRLVGARNDATYSDAEIGESGAGVRAFVVTSREDLQIAREVEALLKRAPVRLG
jgi:acetate kinase